MKRIFSILGLLALAASLSFGAITATTLAAAVSSSSTVYVNVSVATGFAAGYTAIVDNEALAIIEVNGTTLHVIRGASGTAATTHSSGAYIYAGPSPEVSTTLKFHWGKGTLASGSPSSFSVTFGQPYNSLGSYKCTAAIESASAVTTEITVGYTSGSVFTVYGTNSATDVVSWQCVGY